MIRPIAFKPAAMTPAARFGLAGERYGSTPILTRPGSRLTLYGSEYIVFLLLNRFVNTLWWQAPTTCDSPAAAPTILWIENCARLVLPLRRRRLWPWARWRRFRISLSTTTAWRASGNHRPCPRQMGLWCKYVFGSKDNHVWLFSLFAGLNCSICLTIIVAVTVTKFINSEVDGHSGRNRISSMKISKYAKCSSCISLYGIVEIHNLSFTTTILSHSYRNRQIYRVNLYYGQQFFCSPCVTEKTIFRKKSVSFIPWNATYSFKQIPWNTDT